MAKALSHPVEAGRSEGDRIGVARSLAAAGDYAAARAAYLWLLKSAPPSVEALVELGALAAADGFREAARSCFRQAIALDAAHPVALCGLGGMALEEDDAAAAEPWFAAALAALPGFAPAHQGLARCLSARGDPGAEPHWRAGFAGRALVPPRRIAPGAIPLLLVVAARGGNVPCRHWLAPDRFAVTTLYAEVFDPSLTLPPHAIAFNAIGDADLCPEALDAAARLLAGSTSPVINPPDRVARTARQANAARLRAIPHVIAPDITTLSGREALRGWTRFPILLRSPGFHAGKHFVLVRSPAELEAAAASLPGETLLAIDYRDCRGPDGLARKYRAFFIGGEILPLHLAASEDWKVHYFSACMAGSAALRAEEERFLNDMPAVLGARGMAALTSISRMLGLDYAGADFALAPDGSVILFEANATMLIHEPDERTLWDYRRPAIARALGAAKTLLAQCA